MVWCAKRLRADTSSVEPLLSQVSIERYSQVQIAAIVLATVQTIIILVTVIVAWISVRKFRDSQGVNFIIEAETKIDPLFYQLAGGDPGLIRNVYSPYDLSKLTDTEMSGISNNASALRARQSALLYFDESHIGPRAY